MANLYDQYYQTPDLFGAPYPELLAFYQQIEPKGKLLDLGCGQGRDAIPLARMGYDVSGIDNSQLGIAQLNALARQESLSLKAEVADIYAYAHFGDYQFILLDSMFHFGKKEREQEMDLFTTIMDQAAADALITICIQDSGKKVQMLQSVFEGRTDISLHNQQALLYTFEDASSGHRSTSKYQMISLRKLTETPSAL